MAKSPRKRFWLQIILACISGGLTVLTLIWHNWIELLFEMEPDGGDGSAEWAVVLIFIVLTVTFSGLARMEWQRLQAAQQS
jgi:hypothetical protein